MRHIISILMANEAGALVRVAGMFSQRGYNIDSLNVAPTQEDAISRLTLVTQGPEEIVSQINRQLLKLVDVVEVRNMTGDAHLERELALLKVRVANDDLTSPAAAVKAVAQDHGAEIISVETGVHTLQLVGSAAQIEALITALKQTGRLEEAVRSGGVAITPGTQCLRYTMADDDPEAVSF